MAFGHAQERRRERGAGSHARVARVLSGRDGVSLGPGVRAVMEARLGADFSGVRIHTGQVAQETAQSLDATAYTVGSDVAFARGAFDPRSAKGLETLAHELAHVAQSGGVAARGRSAVPGSLSVSGATDTSERQASDAARAVVSGGSYRVTRSRLRAATRRDHSGRLPTDDAPVLLVQRQQAPAQPGPAPQPRPTRDPAQLSDAELDTEYRQARDWLLGHSRDDAAYPSVHSYVEALEGEMRRRAGGATTVGGMPGRAQGGTTAQPVVPATAPPPLSPGVLLQKGAPPPPAGDRAVRVTAAHAGGAYGEHDLPFLLGERGFRFVITSSGPGAHKLTGRGIDAIALDPKSGELWLIDNKASGYTDAVKGESATALGVNLGASLQEAAHRVRAMPDFPDKGQVLDRLEKALSAVRAKKPIPAEIKVKLKVTNAGGYVSGARGLPPGVEFEDVVGPGVRQTRKEDVAKAEAAGVGPGRPPSHRETEAMRRRVGGAMSRQPLKVPVKVRITRGLRGGGIGLAKVVGALLWGAMASRIREKWEAEKIKEWIESQLKAMEPGVQARIEGGVDELINLQLDHLGKPVYAVVGIVTTVHRRGEGKALMEADSKLASVKFSLERVERAETSRETGGSRWVAGKWQNDITRTTYSIELEPFTSEELTAALDARISAEEEAAASSSVSESALLASQRRRNELLARRARLQAR